MSERIAHRGPDDQGIWIQRAVGLAHRRLSILDLTSAAHQPMESSNGSEVIIYNGEIYNFKELREQLIHAGSRFASSGDTEVLLEACRVWGVHETARLANGMFAFAYWDRTRQELWLARDRLGIKPLYYHLDSRRLLFASEIKSLLTHVPPRPDMPAMMCLLNSQPIHDPYTPFEGIRSVEGGQVICVRSGGEFTRSYFFRLQDAVDPLLYDELEALTDREVVGRFDDLLEKSVALHLASDVEVGVMVSGGLDSSLVAHLTHKHHPAVGGYHANVVGPESEFEWAARLAQHTGISLYTAAMSPADYIEHLAVATAANECPLNLHPNTVPFYLACKLASDNSVKVLLTGEGADELFAGYPAFASYRRQRKLARWRDRAVHSLDFFGLGRLGRFLARTTTSDADYGIRSRRTAIATLGRSLDITHAGAEAYAFIRDPIERESQIDLFSYLHSYLQAILWRNDRMGMAVGLESRVPFLENELIRHALNLPLRHKLGAGSQNKIVLRQVADRHLPLPLSRRPKIGFPVNAGKYVAPRDGFFEGGFLATLLDIGHQEIDHLESNFSGMQFNLLLIEVWGQVFFQGREPAEITLQLKDGTTDGSGPLHVAPGAAICT